MNVTIHNRFDLFLQKSTFIPIGRSITHLFFAMILVVPIPAYATYSIAATDSQTRQVGGSGTSCINSSVSIIYGAAPNHGVIHLQALFNNVSVRLRQMAVYLLTEDVPATAVISAITYPYCDSASTKRQYGVVKFGQAAGYTGKNNNDYANDMQGTFENYTYSIQGNILTSQKVLDQAKTAFVNGGCDLADKLMLALEAGAENGEGDKRCTRYGIPSSSAFIHVDAADKRVVLHLEARDRRSNPLLKLRAQYDAWRKNNPCPALDQ